MPPLDVFTLFPLRPAAPADAWRICGFFSSLEMAQAVLQQLLERHPCAAIGDYAIEHSCLDPVSLS